MNNTPTDVVRKVQYAFKRMTEVLYPKEVDRDLVLQLSRMEEKKPINEANIMAWKGIFDRFHQDPTQIHACSPHFHIALEGIRELMLPLDRVQAAPAKEVAVTDGRVKNFSLFGSGAPAQPKVERAPSFSLF